MIFCYLVIRIVPDFFYLEWHFLADRGGIASLSKASVFMVERGLS